MVFSEFAGTQWTLTTKISKSFQLSAEGASVPQDRSPFSGKKFLTALLRYSLRTIDFTHLKCTNDF